MAGLDKSDYYGERDLSCKTDSVKENQSKNGIKASVEQKFPTSASDGFPSNEHDRLLSQAATPGTVIQWFLALGTCFLLVKQQL